MKVLLVYPYYPDTFWSFKYALKFTPKKALNTPLGPITVAAMLPTDWEKRFIDMNIAKLTDDDIKWADYVFISAMVVQQKSALEVAARCKKFNTKVVAGGPLFTTGYGLFNYADSDFDYIIRNEGELTLPPFLEDLRRGCPKPLYQTEARADITQTPTPLYSLLDINKYAQVTVQYSRGCPFDCEFCDIVVIDGHVPRTKTRDQIIAELEAIYNQGYRGSVFFVDDNFIGNKKKLKADTLPAIIKWQEAKKYPFKFLTESSVNLADDENLMQLMSDAGFDNVFVGIESPNEESLTECNKFANKKRDLVGSVRKLQNHGFQVMGGFIVGFDHDPISIFKSQINFIQKSNIVTAMVGLLMAPPETKLWYRLKEENRLILDSTGDNTDGSTNIIPKMNFEVLVNGYRQVLHAIYAPKNYYERINNFLKEYRPNEKLLHGPKIRFHKVLSLIKTSFYLGVKDNARLQYWKLFFSTLRKTPRLFPLAITMAAQGYHFRKVYEKIKNTKIDPRITTKQQQLLEKEFSASPVKHPVLKEGYV
ncbi:MAG: DUF4070 domain-containing protein [Dehalococcoidales bacterium]|nr:DUF4070 domain-containing protein [Dehalococcoidales bacterium]